MAGTGISGALAIAAAFRAEGGASRYVCDDCQLSGQLAATTKWTKCLLVWSVRAEAYAEGLPFLPQVKGTPGLEVVVQVTGPGRERLDMDVMLRGWVGGGGGRTWVYVSGPDAFITAGEEACKRAGAEYYGARW